MIALIDYGSGNLRSVYKSLMNVSDKEVIITSAPEEIFKADRIVLPGVGAYGQCMNGLMSINGMIDALEEAVIKKATPFLGICVGMQLLADEGREFETYKGLGWIKGKVNRLKPENKLLKIPHMGWNEAIPNTDKFFNNAWGNKSEDVYFVHTYAFRAENPDNIAAYTIYGEDKFASAVIKDNIFGLQFHPEKSQKAGLKLLESWLKA